MSGIPITRIITTLSLVMICVFCVRCTVEAIPEAQDAIVFDCGWDPAIKKHLVEWRLCVMDPETMRWGYVEGTEHSYVGPITFTEEGKYITFTEIVARNINGKSFTTESTMGVDQRGNVAELIIKGKAPSWSSDGRYFAYHNVAKMNSSIDVVDTLSSTESILVDGIFDNPWNTVVQVRIDWSPFANLILYDQPTSEGKLGDIKIVNYDTQTVRFFTNGKHATWSPTGASVAFVRDNAIWLKDSFSGEERLLVKEDTAIDWPSWSPSGAKIVYVVNISEMPSLKIVEVDTGRTTLLTTSASWERYPVWSVHAAEILNDLKKTYDY